jgi:hypothetical protein
VNWLSPILRPIEQPKRAVRKKDGALMPAPRFREVEVNGMRYPSMKAACQALGWTYTKVYFAIGEGWRCRGKVHECDGNGASDET